MTWPFHLVDSDATTYRVGPDADPDGGILRLVEADGSRWKQGVGTAPFVFQSEMHIGTGHSALPVGYAAGDIILSFAEGGGTVPGWDNLTGAAIPPFNSINMWSRQLDGSETDIPYSSGGSYNSIALGIRNASGYISDTAALTDPTSSSTFDQPQVSVSAGYLVVHAVSTFTSVVGGAPDDIGADVTINGNVSGGAEFITVGSMIALTSGTSALQTAHMFTYSTDNWCGLAVAIPGALNLARPLRLVDSDGMILDTIPMVFESGPPGTGTYPSTTTFPSSTTYPGS